MAKELKYRGYWKGVNKMVYFDKAEYAYTKDGRVGMFIESVGGAGVYMGNSIDMEFIGLKDFNGFDIYDGDIIRSYDSRGREIRHKIEYDSNQAKFIAIAIENPVCRTIGCSITKQWITEFKKEVIGNIYLNPELLTPII